MRQETGFHSAYAFYHDNGGRRVFPFSYPYYSRIEHGRALPRPAWLPVLLASLRMPPAVGNYRDFVVAYLRDIFGDDDLFEDMVAPWIRPPQELPVTKKAARRLMGAQSHNISLEQFDAILSSPAAFWCFLCLTKSREPMSLEDLMKTTELPAAQIQTGLRKLAAEKLAKRAAGGRFFSPLWEHYSIFPRHGKGHEERIRTFCKYIDQVAERRGKDLMTRRAIVRAEEADMLGITQILHETMDAVHASAVNDKGHRTKLYTVETRLREVFPF
jgi:hypothetical protein